LRHKKSFTSARRNFSYGVRSSQTENKTVAEGLCDWLQFKP